MTDVTGRRAPMSPGRWEQVERVLAGAIECREADRGPFLDNECAGDGELRREVEALLAAHEQPGAIDQLADAVAPAVSRVREQAGGWQGAQIGQYLVLELLGAGGMGVVYKARDERLERHVALKFLSPHLSLQPGARERFLTEARAAAALDHPNVCTIHEIGETVNGHLFLAMPLYEGETLERRLARGRLPFREAVGIGIQIARGLARAHDNGIVHRDVKPSNVMLLADGSAKILDFGIAKRDHPAPGGRVAPAGTIAYMSPEQMRGVPVDHRADIWSLGVLLHEMLTGVRPFDGSDREDLAGAILSDDPAILTASHPDVPAGMDDFLRRALAKQADDRHPSMTALAAALDLLASPPHERTHGDSGVPALTGHAGDSVTPRGGERRRAAVLVSILSGYDALVEQLSPAEAVRVLEQVRAAAVDVARRHGGLVNQAIGEEMVSLFGVPVAHEDDELRAVRAAVELHARVRALTFGPGATIPVRVQSGLHAGPVVAQRLQEGPRRYAVVGAPAQVAARLAALARPDDVVMSPEYRRVVSPFVHTSAYEPVMLEPGVQPVTPFRVTGETGVETRLEASERLGLTPYVGRDAELARLWACAAQARAGDGGTLVVVGEAGAGKSRLLHELRERVGESPGFRLLQARCRAYGDVEPFFPFVEILRDALDMRAAVSDSAAIVARIRGIDPALEPFLPLYLHLLSVPSESHPLPRHFRGEHLQASLLDALSAVIAGLARERTLVVLLEDWHWADGASSTALQRMSEDAGVRKVLFVVTTRPRPARHEEWPAAAQVRLDPLDFETSAAMMRAVLRVGRLPDGLGRLIFERTGGNPFFLEQVCSALLEQGAVATTTGEAIVEGGVEGLLLPDTVQAVIRTRLDTLEPASREVLRVASVIGRDFEHALVAEVLGEDVDLPVVLARLRGSGLVQEMESGTHAADRFDHVLTQEVSYDSLLGHQRKTLHGMVGRAIERRHADGLDEKAALLAHHFERAGAWPDAVRYGRRAAERASSLSQFAEALAMLDRVLAWLDELPDGEARRDLKADLLLQQERECETLGLRSRQREIISDLIAHVTPGGPSARLAEAYLRQGNLFTLLKRFDAADRALGTALRVSREQGDTALERNALRSMGLLRWHEGRHAEALAITRNALAIAREHQDELAVAGDLTNLGNILKSLGDYAAARSTLEEAMALRTLADDPKKMVFALHNLANVHRAMGDPERAIARLRQADEICRTHLLPIQRSFHLTSMAHIELQQGRLDNALRTYREAIELSRRARHAEGLAQSLRTLGDVLFVLGMGDQALPHLQEAAVLFAQLEDPEAEADMCSRAAEVLANAHRPAESRLAWDRARELRQRLGDIPGQLDALEGIARATREQDGPGEAAVNAFEAALLLASALGEKGRALSLRNTLGILAWSRGRFADALTHYEAALVLVREQTDRGQEGLILNSLGVTLTELRRPEEARTALEDSLAICRESGERLLQAHALATLGRVCRMVGQLDRAADYFEASRELRSALGDRSGEAWMLHRLAETRAGLGDQDAANAASSAAARLAADSGDVALIEALRSRTPVN